MASDDESNKKAVKLETREEFPGWKERMGLLALEKGDFDGVFSDLGNNPCYTTTVSQQPLGQQLCVFRLIFCRL